MNILGNQIVNTIKISEYQKGERIMALTHKQLSDCLSLVKLASSEQEINIINIIKLKELEKQRHLTYGSGGLP
jgi:hypothetical protein